MPIFQDDLGRVGTPPPQLNFQSHSPILTKPMRRKISEESIRTELCEGPIFEDQSDTERSPLNGVDNYVRHSASQGVTDRVELIERLKRGESPTWLPNKNLESLLYDYDTRTFARSPVVNAACSPPLLPSAEIKEPPQPSFRGDDDTLQAGLSIERPRSALHTGDFTQKGPQQANCYHRGSGVESDEALYDTTSRSWLSTSPLRDYIPFQQGSHSRCRSVEKLQHNSRTASVSSSLSSSFVFKPPTSPLARSESNDDGDYSSAMVPINISAASPGSSRRHTFQASQWVYSTPSMVTSSTLDRQSHHFRREHSTPYQAHQPRRSISSGQGLYQTDTLPQTPGFLRSRVPSFNSDSSPLQLASMVGSYEESILRGRMSTTPSRPLDFVAQIGVLGLGKCKPSLRCPAHVTLTFPAVFYSYGTTSHGRIGSQEDGPSPYVGQIDLENGLPQPDDATREFKRRRPRFTPDRTTTGDADDQHKPGTSNLTEREIRQAQKEKRLSASPRAPLGGSYKIPERGQLQIIIKNPNKTAVKLFLIPYDLTGMEPGTKTFIRQRSYSAGPVVDLPPAASAQSQNVDPSNERATLRYLVHIHVCCPSRGRFYLYKGIRVVFANRVPDDKEKLRNEIQLPEPRFSVYKANRESAHGVSPAGVSLAAEKAFRRRSSGFALSPSHRFDAMDGITHTLQARVAGDPPYPHHSNFSRTPVEPMPSSLFRRNNCLNDQEAQIQSPLSSKSSQSQSSMSQDSGLSASWNSASSSICGYDKLNKGDVGYGGNAFAGRHNGQRVAAEGLLAQKLKGLGVTKIG